MGIYEKESSDEEENGDDVPDNLSVRSNLSMFGAE
jgi:hypothetical protein